MEASRDEFGSPCVRVCQLDDQTGFCRGCFRTLDEIAIWPLLDESGRHRIRELIQGRRSWDGAST